MMHFVRTFLIMRAQDVRRIAIREVRNYEKIVGLYIRNIFENGWWVDAYPSTYLPGSAPGISYENYQKSLAYLSPLILLFFTKRQKQKGKWHGTSP